ncbi:MAG TPA: cyclic pyranopterin monophosphate synthase MoaC [Acidimicrobiia bacterium]|nr:cyclic pyranopterin monophosphate synthase MoaC [Acidimicrobiia bacterium]
MSSELPHLTEEGHAHMVDVSAKEATVRRAVAEGLITMPAALAARLFAGDLPKGDALAAVRLAGIMAAKRTADLIPLCHPLRLDGVEVEVKQSHDGTQIRATVVSAGPTGVEMEAMTAVAVAALTLYDMVKGLERGVEIGPIRLLHKSGGKSGTWERQQ